MAPRLLVVAAAAVVVMTVRTSAPSVAVALQVIQAAGLVATLLHDAPLHLGLVAALLRRSLPQPGLQPAPPSQDPWGERARERES